MLGGARIAVVVPAHNEERLIARTLRSVPSWVDQIVVVDDASTDATIGHVRSVPDDRIQVERHEDNRGVGAAIATGYAVAFANGADIAAVMAGDGQMDPRDLSELLAPVMRGDAEYCKGNRLSFPGARRLMPRSRWLGNDVLTVLTTMACGVRVRDSQCGYTALGRDAWQLLRGGTLWPRYGYPNDMIGSVLGAGLRIAEVTVRPVYGEEKSGIGLQHALLVVPYVLARVALRRILHRVRGLQAPGHTTRRPEVPTGG